MKPDYEILMSSFSGIPFWSQDVEDLNAHKVELRKRYDFVIVGGGYTGLVAAIQLARRGLAVVVLDAMAPDGGASSRNGGQISGLNKPSYSTLKDRFGTDTAADLMQEGAHALEWIKEFIKSEGLDCDLRVTGRFKGAHSARAFDRLAKAVEIENTLLDSQAFMVAPEDQRSEVATDFYHGGAVFPKHASLQPAKYHAELRRIAQEAGVDLRYLCRVNNVEKNATGYEAVTSLGKISATNIIVATNGYTTGQLPQFVRGIIPISSRIIVTDELPREVLNEVLPNDRVVNETRRVMYYYRQSPEGTRLIFGGRDKGGTNNAVLALHQEMSRLFPNLDGVGISHSWAGLVGFTFDKMPHLGQLSNGIFYSLGYCGSGVSVSSYLGHKIAMLALNDPAGETPFMESPFPVKRLYSGNPWFLPLVSKGYHVMDRLGL